MKGTTPCSVDGCSRPASGRGLCGMHRARLRRHGEIGPAGPTFTPSWAGATCGVPNCSSPVKSQGWCLAHYKRWRRWGDPQVRRPKRPAAERFWEKVDKSGPIPAERPHLGACWIWTAGRTAQGYGGFHPTKRETTTAHRWSYEAAHGPVGAELVIDHLCRVRLCVNPAHLEAVTNLENLRRGAGYGVANGMRSTCIHGHPYTPENTYIQPSRNTRSCRACRRERDQKRAGRTGTRKQAA